MKLFSSLILAGFFLALNISTSGAEDRAPLSVEGAETITTDTAKNLLDEGAIFIDLRTPDDFDKAHIPGAENLELMSGFNRDNLEMLADADETVVFYCYGTGCLRSSMASESAVKWGYSHIKYYREGWPAWTKAGLAVEISQ